MPIYEYACESCKNTQEIIQKFNDPPPHVCPICNDSGSLHKTVSQSAFHLKGGGWYKDLYSSKKPEGTKEKKSSAKKADSKKPAENTAKAAA